MIGAIVAFPAAIPAIKFGAGDLGSFLLARSFYGLGVAVGLPTLAVALYSSFAP